MDWGNVEANKLNRVEDIRVPWGVPVTFPAGLFPAVFSPPSFPRQFFPADFYFSSYEEKTMKQEIS